MGLNSCSAFAVVWGDGSQLLVCASVAWGWMSAPMPLLLGVYLNSDWAATVGDGAGLWTVCGFRDWHLGSSSTVHWSVLTQSVHWSNGARCAGGLRLLGPSRSHCLLPGKTQDLPKWWDLPTAQGEAP
uniref:Uncharacterized protein n=1 Tax=Molossus molossus TaxID=27622 RepID=A0A7J8DBN1_MOLMO|nr:hypothetical protein HJG59_009323 [Molossus molossus]